MPIDYQRDDRRHLITVTVLEPFSFDDLLDQVDRQWAEKAWDYAVLYDARTNEHFSPPTEIQRLVERVRVVGGGRPRGHVGLAIPPRPHTDYPSVVTAIAALPAGNAVLDGEIVALDGDGRPSFQALQHRRTGAVALVYYAFDLLEIDGASLLRTPLDERRRRLKALIRGSRLLLSDVLPGSPERIEEEIRKLRLEGVVAKRRDSLYVPGERTDTWVKVKFSPRQEFVVGGYKPNASNFDSILVGYFEKRSLNFAGRVRAGFTPHMRAEVMRRIADRSTSQCPFANLPNSTGKSHWGEGITADDMKTFRWVKPAVVVEVGFVEWTAEGLLRHSAFVGIREDKRASAVRRDRAG